ncbi:hypothetical protein DV736_g3815, partial [Chaetothyriales sp. CBS 134916]
MAGDETDRKDSSTPSWQQQTLPEPSTPSTPPTRSADASTDTPTGDVPLDLIEHARRFLDDESVKDSSRDRKEAFLKEKGLSDAQVETLLAEPVSSPEDELKTSPPPPPSDSPPIITYPEFLLKEQKPPPLVTLERLGNAATAVAALSALTWGASKFLVQPMRESLTAARHDLFSTAEQSLDTLNTKLESTVSHVPYIAPLHSHRIHSEDSGNDHNDDDDESIASDPTELFHRDIATQTSPPESRTASLSSSTNAPSVAAALITDQSTKLASLHVRLSSLLSSTETHFSETALFEAVSKFQSLITALECDSSPLSRTRPFSPSPSTNNLSLSKDRPTEIRALKGAFLSSRSFPAIRNAAP